MTAQNGTGHAPSDGDDADGARHNLHQFIPQLSPSTPTARTNSQHYQLGTRSGLAGDNIRDELWTNQYGGERSLYKALGYVIEPRYEHYRARYERTDEARALVDKLPRKAWATPEIRDPGASDGDSAFEEAVEQFLDSDAGAFADTALEPLASSDALESMGPALARGDVIEVCQRASRMERLGEFSMLFLGLDDAAVSGGDIEALESPVAVDSLDSLDDLTYVEAYDQGRADDTPFELHDDVTDPRFGTPEYYNVDLGHSSRSAKIHYSRVVHVVDDVFEDILRNNSILEQSLNRLDDIEKIQGASAEAFWRTAYQGLIARPPQVGNQQASFADSGEDLHKQIKKYYSNFQRAIFTGAEVDTLDVSAEDPASHLETKYRSLATGHGIPQSILMGNETGERATTEDRQMWHELVADYRESFCEARVLRPLLDRLIYYGILPAPEGGSYDVVWPPLDEPSEQDEADVASTKAEALNTATAGNPTLAATVGEIREELFGWKGERGSESESGDGATEMQSAASVEEMLPPESDLAAAVRANADGYAEGDPVDTPKGVGVIAGSYTETVSYDGETWEASPESPVYEVVLATEDPPFWFFKASDLEALDDISTGVESPEEDLAAMGDRTNAASDDAASRANLGFRSWPDWWEDADTPARLIALDAWTSLGGTWRGCFAEIGDREICSAFKDEMYQTTKWRGGFVD